MAVQEIQISEVSDVAVGDGQELRVAASGEGGSVSLVFDEHSAQRLADACGQG
jgi:hypothetical protein